MQYSVVTVFGGSGFLGRYVVRALAKAGYRIRVAVRHPNLANFLLPMGRVGQIQLLKTDVKKKGQIAAAVSGAGAVINLTGILYERGRQTFQSIHVDAAAAIAGEARTAGATRLIHISAIGANADSDSGYARTKAEGEARVRAQFPDATIIRPSLLIGAEDDFFNRFAALARLSPALPLIGGGHTKFQPAFVGDAATAICNALAHEDTRGQAYELGGPKVYTFRALMDLMLHETGRRRTLVPIPFGLAMFKSYFLQYLPRPLLTPDQVRLLKTDNVVHPGAPGFAELGVTPDSIEIVLPSYLWRFRREGQFSPNAPDRFNVASILQ